MIDEIKGDGSKISNKPKFLELNKEVRIWVINHCIKKYMGYLYSNGHVFILVSIGKVPTRGYKIEVEVVNEDDDILVKGVIKKPEKSSRRLRVISYPMVLIWFKCDGKKAIRFMHL